MKQKKIGTLKVKQFKNIKNNEEIEPMQIIKNIKKEIAIKHMMNLKNKKNH